LISSSTISDETKDAFLSDNFKVAFDSVSIFVDALVIWGICAAISFIVCYIATMPKKARDPNKEVLWQFLKQQI